MNLAIYRFTPAEMVGRKVVTWGLLASGALTPANHRPLRPSHRLG